MAALAADLGVIRTRRFRAMSPTLRLIGSGSTLLVVVTALALWEGRRWRKGRDAQCEAARPLVAGRATIAEVRRVRSRPPSEHTSDETAQLVRSFGASSDKST